MSTSNINIPADMLSAIEACYVRCEQMVDDLGSHADTVRTPDTAYHYTDGAGLFGIFDGGTIRLSDILGLNDPSEIRHGLKYACDILETEAKRAHPAATLFADKFRALPNSVEATAHYFVACFSKNGNDLGQWRGYGDNGHGFALGFDGQVLEERFVLQDGERITNNSTFSIRYADDALRDLQQALIREALPLIALPTGRRLDAAVISNFMKELSMRLSLCALRAALLFKHEGYKNEEEFRLLHIRPFNDPLPDLKHRARGHSLIRFIEFNWKSNAARVLREVVIGPAADEATARAFVEKCLQRADIDPATIHIHKSGIPYRG